MEGQQVWVGDFSSPDPSRKGASERGLRLLTLAPLGPLPPLVRGAGLCGAIAEGARAPRRGGLRTPYRALGAPSRVSKAH